MNRTVRTSDDIDLAVEVQGPEDATALLFLNSIGCSRAMWAPQVESLSTRYRTITYDARGHGDSDAPAGDYTLDRLARDAMEVLDALQVERAHLCGLSLGGLTAQKIALDAPARIGRLALAATGSRLGSRESWEARRTLVLEEGLAAIADMAMERFFTPAFRQTHPETVDRHRAMLLACSRTGYAGCCAALRDADLTTEVGRIAAPTLVVGGGEDVSTPPLQTLSLARAIPGARFDLLPAGHLSNVERPAEFTAVVETFLE